jgi:hypothetical protein
MTQEDQSHWLATDRLSNLSKAKVFFLAGRENFLVPIYYLVKNTYNLSVKTLIFLVLENLSE